MLTDALKAFINKLFLKSFDTIFMKNIKNYQKSQLFFFFKIVR